jgi:hypothetical protein
MRHSNVGYRSGSDSRESRPSKARRRGRADLGGGAAGGGVCVGEGVRQAAWDDRVGREGSRCGVGDASRKLHLLPVLADGHEPREAGAIRASTCAGRVESLVGVPRTNAGWADSPTSHRLERSRHAGHLAPRPDLLSYCAVGARLCGCSPNPIESVRWRLTTVVSDIVRYAGGEWLF